MSRAVRRRGFVLLAILWMLVGLGALSLALQHRSGDSVRSVSRRAELERSHWLAEECIARSRVVMAEALAADSMSTTRTTAWRRLDSLVQSAPLVRSCPGAVTLRADGARLDVNVATSEQLRRLLTRVVDDASAADSMADAILDWRDADDVARPAGAERAWYAAHRRVLPRDGPFADVREVARVRGLERVGDIDALLGVDTGPVSLVVAPLIVLSSLPGLDDEALARIADLRARGAMFDDPLSISAQLSHNARDSLEAHRWEIADLTTTEPRAWTLRATGLAGAGAAATTIERRFVRSPRGARVVRTRVWP